MNGHMRERKPGVWELIIFRGNDPVTGKKLYRSVTVRGTKRDAETERARLVTESQNEPVGSKGSMRWLLDEYVRLLEAEGRAHNTLTTYRGYIKNWINPALGSTAIEDVTAGDIRRLSAKMQAAGLGPSTRRQTHAILQGALRFAVENEWREHNPALAIRRPQAPRSNVVLPTMAEVDRLYREAGPVGSDLTTAVALGALLGRRLGELCSLRWSDFDTEEATVHVAASTEIVQFVGPRLKDTKTHATTTMSVGPLVLERLAERKTFQAKRAAEVGCELVDDPFVLSRNADGSGPVRPDGYSSSFADLRKRLGYMHVTFKSLRHFNLSRLVLAGVNVLTVAERGGHADASMIGKVYGHGSPEADRAAAQIELMSGD